MQRKRKVGMVGLVAAVAGTATGLATDDMGQTITVVVDIWSAIWQLGISLLVFLILRRLLRYAIADDNRGQMGNWRSREKD